MIKWLYRNIVPLKIRTVIFHRYLDGGCRFPEPIFVEHVEKLKLIGQGIRIRCAEVGVYKGSTSRAVLELLEANDQLDLYDRESSPLFRNRKEFEKDKRVVFFENSNLEHDSYVWSIMKQIKFNADKSVVPIYDLVFIDGAHVFTIDYAANELMKKLLKPGGIIILSDLYWTIDNSPSMNNRKMRKSYTVEQRHEANIGIVVKCSLESDENFTRIESSDINSAVFQKLRED
jgi:SAM-dependent methyltransferase